MEIRTVSLCVSSVILIAGFITSLISWLYWHQHKKEPRLPLSQLWKTVLRHVVMATTPIGFGISLLVSSVSRNEKTCVILLLCFGRVLIIGQVGCGKDLTSLVLTILGRVHLGKLFFCAVQTYALDRVGCLQLLSWVDYLPCPGYCSRSSCSRYDQNRSSFICVGVGGALPPICVAALVAKKGLVQAVQPLTRIDHERIWMP
jgi:hypothetical protein